ncbi:MAG: hypothetical protein KH009_03260 [Clostridiales bacterium]|nr:hypothetical protein [Clostridiales bacterium]
MGSFPVRCEVGAGTGVNMGGTAEALQLLSRLDTGQGLFFCCQEVSVDAAVQPLVQTLARPAEHFKKFKTIRII